MKPSDVIQALASFVPSEDDTENVSRLYDIFDGFGDHPGREVAVPAMFELIERYPDAGLGTPGPIVHELEAIDGYQDRLSESIHRQPGYLNIWMVNRILNAETRLEQRQGWMELLQVAAVHPAASASSRQDAVGFINYQRANS